jgi:hypothetical protein
VLLRRQSWSPEYACIGEKVQYRELAPSVDRKKSSDKIPSFRESLALGAPQLRPSMKDNVPIGIGFYSPLTADFLQIESDRNPKYVCATILCH